MDTDGPFDLLRPAAASFARRAPELAYRAMRVHVIDAGQVQEDLIAKRPRASIWQATPISPAMSRIYQPTQKQKSFGSFLQKRTACFYHTELTLVRPQPKALAPHFVGGGFWQWPIGEGEGRK